MNGDIDDLVLFRAGSNININDAGEAAIHASAEEASIDFRDPSHRLTMRILGDVGNIRLGGTPDADGDILLYPSRDGVNINDNAQATIHLNGNAGDIVLRNADCAEEFDVAAAAEGAAPVVAGTVMVLDEEGKLRPSRTAYDKRVVGVVSGAGEYRPGIVLDRQPGSGNRRPIALVGKVYCQVTAETAPIDVGDLLTTADVPGHAMKAGDPARVFGAVIGKALQPLRAGRGLVPILVVLQ